MGVLPTKRTKKSCSMTEEETVRREGSRSSSFPKRLGWLGYWLRTYSSSAHCDFSCRLSMCAASDRPQASAHRTAPAEAAAERRRAGGEWREEVEEEEEAGGRWLVAGNHTGKRREDGGQPKGALPIPSHPTPPHPIPSRFHSAHHYQIKNATSLCLIATAGIFTQDVMGCQHRAHPNHTHTTPTLPFHIPPTDTPCCRAWFLLQGAHHWDAGNLDQPP